MSFNDYESLVFRVKDTWLEDKTSSIICWIIVMRLIVAQIKALNNRSGPGKRTTKRVKAKGVGVLTVIRYKKV